ncbi:Nsp1-like C-terminal region-domain-containing protein [Mycena sp. CBHHK59/15]|nr:Nsp1-like C-terminal region-domain-containing protein [Mycena sp. CBHHK59/15]
MSIFGNQAGSSGGGAFSNNPSSTTAAPTNIFGGGGLGGTGFGGGATAPASGGLFGNNSTTSTALASGGHFGGGSSAQPPQNNNALGGAAAGSSNIFGGSSTAPSAAPSVNIFSASTQPPASNPLSGGAFSKPAEPTAGNQQKPATPNFFNQPNTSSAAPAVAPATGGLFGLPAKPADAPSTSTLTTNIFGKPAGTAAAAPLSSPFSLGGNKDGITPSAAPSGGFFAKPAAATAPGPAPASTQSPFSLGGNKDGTSTPAASLFGPSKPDEKKETPLGLPSFGLSKPAAKEDEKAPTSLASALTTGAGPIVAVAPPSMLRGKTIEEIVNKWSSELETHVREFNKFAGEVAVWDRALIENGNNLAALYSHVLSAEREQNDIDQSLDHIEQQQKDLTSTLDAYEKATQEVFGGYGGNLRALDTGPADTERDKNYMLATDLHTQLDDLSGSLTQMIESVNDLSLPSGQEVSADDPMAQIAQILGSHLESLQWIDDAVREVEGKVTEVEKRVKESGYTGPGASGTKRGFGL